MQPTKRLTILEIIEREPAVWFATSKQQRIFLMEYVAGGLVNGKYDHVAACRVAYPKVKACAVWASRLMTNPRIKKVIAVHRGLGEGDMILADIKALIKRSRRKGVNLDVLVAPWLRAVAALESFVAKGTDGGTF